MNEERAMPVGIQTFEDIRKYNFVYVDKTDYVHKIARQKGFYFLGRPRRFGKSLFLSTLEAYFLGKRDLFQGLKLAELEQDWTEYPVLYFDLNAGKYTSVKDLESHIARHLRSFERHWGSDPEDDTLVDRFIGVIERAYEQSGKQVVILVDEYDKPLINTLENEALHEDLRIELKAFYGVLKSVGRYVRCAFLTGVTKFGGLSVFSDLNMLCDISMLEEYGCVCGIT